MKVLLSVFTKICDGWNNFFHRQADLSIFGPIRIAFALLLLFNVLLLGPNLEMWFGENGLLPLDISRIVVDEDTYTIFQFLPKTNAVLWSCYLLLVTNLICLLVGFLTRVQLIFIFVLFASFCHRCNIIFDGEDTLFRMMTFYLIFSPCGKYLSVDNWLASRKEKSLADDNPGIKRFAIWPLRLFQIQTACVLFFSGIEKLKGVEWRDGTALYYVSRLDDLFYRFPLPEFLFDSLTMIALATWGAVVLELTIPILVWFRKTRMWAVAAAVLFHLALDYMMNLNMFQWLMIVGWISFLGPKVSPTVDNENKQN